MKEILEEVKITERVLERIEAHSDDMPVPQVIKEILVVVEVSPQEHVLQDRIRQRTFEQFADTPAWQVVEEPVFKVQKRLVEQMIEVQKISSKDQTLQRTKDQMLDFPMPRKMEQLEEVLPSSSSFGSCCRSLLLLGGGMALLSFLRSDELISANSWLTNIRKQLILILAILLSLFVNHAKHVHRFFCQCLSLDFIFQSHRSHDSPVDVVSSHFPCCSVLLCLPFLFLCVVPRGVCVGVCVCVYVCVCKFRDLESGTSKTKLLGLERW